MAAKTRTAEQKAADAARKREARARAKAAAAPTDEFGFPESYQDAAAAAIDHARPTAAHLPDYTAMTETNAALTAAASLPIPVPEPKAEPPAAEPTVRAISLYYDIPQASKLNNPSWFLRRFGFRANLSCWIVPEAALEALYPLIKELNDGGANVRFFKFDASEGPALVREAIRVLKKDVADQVRRATANLAAAGERHLVLDEDLAENVSARETALGRYELRAAAVCEALETLLDDVQNAIRQFGVDPAALDLGGAAAAFESFQVGIAARTAAYNAATNALRAAGTVEAVALANAAAVGAGVPVAVMAGALEDAGDEAGARALAETFNLGDAFAE